MNSAYYKHCIVPQCQSTTIKTPNKLFIYVPNKEQKRRKWLELARRDDAHSLSIDSRMYFCEDHFNLPIDMVNYMEYHLMGTVAQVRMKPDCSPSKFDCQNDRTKRTCSDIEQSEIVKKQIMMTIDDRLQELEESTFSSCLQNTSDTSLGLLRMDSQKLVSVDLDQICRICMERNIHLTNIFSSTAQYSIISNAVMECAPVQITHDDMLPTSICAVCIEKLDQAYRFRILCVESDITLRQMISQPLPEFKPEIDQIEIKEEPCNDYDDKTRLIALTEVDSQGQFELKVSFNPTTTEVDSDKINKIRNATSSACNDVIRLYSCSKCQYRFKRKHHLDRHEQRCLNNRLRRQIKMKTELNCIESQIVKPKVKRMKIYRPNKANIVEQPDGRFSCRFCNKSYTTKYHVVRHAVIHSDFRYKCPECHKSFLRTGSLKAHIKIHTGERRCSCEFCGKTFQLDTSLMKHRRIHLEVKPYKCTICQRAFTQSKTLTNHMRIHTGERPFVCETCGRNFNRKHILKRHKMMHTGERPHKCKICGQDFVSKQHLKMHFTTHTGAPSKTYTCKICNKEFASSAMKVKHIKTHDIKR